MVFIICTSRVTVDAAGLIGLLPDKHNTDAQVLYLRPEMYLFITIFSLCKLTNLGMCALVSANSSLVCCEP